MQIQADGATDFGNGKNCGVEGGFCDVMIVINERIVDGMISVLGGMMLLHFTFSGKSHTRSTGLNNKLRSHF